MYLSPDRHKVLHRFGYKTSDRDLCPRSLYIYYITINEKNVKNEFVV